jgi:hypothetical protein
MAKKYICVRNSIRQFEADNWLLMIPDNQLSAYAKIVYIILKRMQSPDLSCMTDSNSWYKISGMKMDVVLKHLIELQNYGLIELYHSASNANGHKRNTTYTAYLLNHYLMKGCYPVRDCPHDGDSFAIPYSPNNILQHSAVDKAIKGFLEDAKGYENEPNTTHKDASKRH